MDGRVWQEKKQGEGGIFHYFHLESISTNEESSPKVKSAVMLSQDDGCHSVEQQLRPLLWNECLTCQFSVEVSLHGVNGSLTASCQPVRTNLDFQWTEDDFQRRDEEMHFPAHSVIINIFIIRSKSASSLFNFFLHGGSHETKTYQIAGG